MTLLINNLIITIINITVFNAVLMFNTEQITKPLLHQCI